MAGTVEIGLLGPVLVRVDGADVRLASTPQRVLIARLALADGRQCAPAALIDTLWYGGPPANAAGNLHAYVSRLRQVIGTGRITREPGGYRLDVPADKIDIGRAEALVESARATPEPVVAADLFGAALAVWRGEPLSDLPDPAPFAPDLARLAEWRRQVREEWFAARLAAGQAERALPDLEQAATADPDREKLHVLLATALHHTGRTAEALRVVDVFRRRLADESGLDPSAALSDLAGRLLADDPELRRPDRQPLPPVPVTLRTVVTPLNRFIGRADDLATVDAALAEHRIVTVVGPGGMGKTRLSLELLDRRDGRIPARVVELALLSGDRDVPLAAATAFGLQVGTVASIAELVGPAEVLLVLDNCEHVRVAARDLAAELVARCPGLRILATSRQRLGVPGEKVVRLSPLSPDDQVELFCDRAALLRDDFRASPEERRLAGEICRSLDGLPLAVELAASREAVLGLRQLRDRLAAGIDVLEPARDPDRTTAVTATVEWSYRLLDPAAQQLFDALVVCRGGFRIDALEYLTPGGNSVPLLAELVEASLVVSQHSADGPPRYRLLEVMRRVGLDHLGADRLPAARDRHAAWMTEHTRHVAELQRGRSHLAMPLIRAELVNVREALSWLIDSRQWTAAGRLGLLVASVLAENPDLAVLAQLERLALVPTDLDADTVGRCETAAGTARWLQGDHAEADRLLGDALRRLPPDHTQRWAAQAFLLYTHLFQGRVNQVQADAVALLESPNVPEWVAAVGVSCAALSHLFAGERAAGERLLAAHATLLGRAGALDGFISYTHGEFAAESDPQRALDLFARAAAMSGATGQRYHVEVASVARAAVLIRLRRGAEAARACHDSLRRLRTTGMWPQLWMMLRLSAELLVDLGDLETAGVLLAAGEADPQAPAVVGPDRVRQVRMGAAIERGLGADGAAAARRAGGSLTRRAVVERALAALGRYTDAGPSG